MSYFINRESLIRTMEQTPFTMSMCLTPEECHAMNLAKKILTNAVRALPASDVTKREPEAEWIPLPREKDGGPLDEWLVQFPVYMCPVCTFQYLSLDKEKYKFCPECGVRMETEET